MWTIRGSVPKLTLILSYAVVWMNPEWQLCFSKSLLSLWAYTKKKRFVTRTDFCTFAPRNNLYNTNAEFDWGDLRSLREEVREASQKFLFLFQFQYPGTYVLQLSSNHHKKMVCIKESCLCIYNVPLSKAFHVPYECLETQEILNVIVSIFSFLYIILYRWVQQ